MNPIVFTLLILAMLATLLTLVAGIVTMVKGGELNAKYGNKLMQARVACQGLALLLFALAYLVHKSS